MNRLVLWLAIGGVVLVGGLSLAAAETASLEGPTAAHAGAGDQTHDALKTAEMAVAIGALLFFTVWEFARPGHSVNRLAHLRLDLFAFAVVVFGSEWAKLAAQAGIEGLGLPTVVPIFTTIQELPTAVRIVLALLCSDFVLYWVHWAMHRSDTLWRTHAWHHSISELFWLSGSRTSLAHLMLFAIPQWLLAMVVFRLSVLEMTIALTVATIVNIWLHANISVRLGWFGKIVFTPDHHRIHHSKRRAQSDTNYGFILTIWDRLFGTYLDPQDVTEPFNLGLVGYDKTTPRMVLGV